MAIEILKNVTANTVGTIVSFTEQTSLLLSGTLGRATVLVYIRATDDGLGDDDDWNILHQFGVTPLAVNVEKRYQLRGEVIDADANTNVTLKATD